MSTSFYKIMFPVTDIDRAETFYSTLFGASGRRVSADRHDFDCAGMILSCQLTENRSAVSDGQTVWFAVDDLDAAFQQATQAGCVIADSQVVTHPWGDRLFEGEDPFKNLVGFVDRTTMERQKGESQQGGPEDRLNVGLVMSVQPAQGNGEKRLGASICKIFQHEIWLQFVERPGAIFSQGDAVQLQYYEDRTAIVAYTDVVQVSSSDEHFLAVSIPESLELLQRRAAPRVATVLPVRFSVKASEDETRVSALESEVESRDISTGGMRFDTDRVLEKEDVLDLKLMLSSEDQLTVTAKVTDARTAAGEDKTLNSVGLQFVEMPLDDQIKLLEFLIQREEGEDEHAPVATPSVPSSAETTAPLAAEPSAVQEPTSGGELSIPEVGGSDQEERVQVLDGVLEEESNLAPVVQARAVIESGKPFLELANGFRDPVKVTSASVAKGAGARVELLSEATQLEPGEKKQVEVTQGLLELFDSQSSETQERKVQVVLSLHPEPPTQPGPSLYHVKFAGQNFTHFSGGI